MVFYFCFIDILYVLYYNYVLERDYEKQVLETDVKKLQDPDYVAKYAREKYLYSKDGELIIKIVDND